MNYLDELARRIHALAEPGGEAPTEGDILLYRTYAVLALAKGAAVTNEDVHNAWAAWAAQYEPEHRSLVPYDELPEAAQRLDAPYADAIRAAFHGEPARADAALYDAHPGELVMTAYSRIEHEFPAWFESLAPADRGRLTAWVKSLTVNNPSQLPNEVNVMVAHIARRERDLRGE